MIIDIDMLAQTKGALLGIDPGTKTFGLALSDETRLIASPLETIRRKKFTQDAKRIFNIYDEHKCAGLVIGWPVNMDGSLGPRAQSVNDFCTNLLAMRDVPILLWDERLSSAAVTRSMLEADMSRVKRSLNIDKLASAYILQGALDRLRAKAPLK